MLAMEDRPHDVPRMSATRSEPLLQITLLGEAVEHAPVGVFVFDDRGEYVAVNRFGCELLGYEREDVLGARVGQFAVDPAEAIRSYRTVAEGRAYEGITRVRRGDGTVGALRFRARETAIGGIKFYIGIAWPAEPGSEPGP
jgi:PAS domain S-box-containing protein